jgi:hypothetical protein
LARIRRELVETHERLLKRIADLPDTVVDTEFEKRLGKDTWDHYREHAEQIRAWRNRR